MEIWDYGAIFSKFALYTGILFSAGSVFYSLVFESPETKETVHSKSLTFYFCILGLFATFASFSFSGATLAGDISGIIDWEILGILWQTPVKYSFIIRVLGLGLILVGMFSVRFGLLIQLLGALIAIGSFSLTGHVSQTDHVLFSFLLFIHLSLLALWLGILIPLYRLSKVSGLLKPTALIAHRFGQLASFFVPVLIVAGLWLAYQLVGSFEKLIGTSYGVNLIIKVGLVSAILALAAVNKLRIVPSMQAGNQNARKHLTRSVNVETILVFTVLLATAVLTSVQTLPGAG